MELLVAFVIKFFSIIYGAIYGTLASIPVIREWITLNKIGVTIAAGRISIENKRKWPLVILDGQVFHPGGTVRIERSSLAGGQILEFPCPATGEVHVWLMLVELKAGKELVVTANAMLE